MIKSAANSSIAAKRNSAGNNVKLSRQILAAFRVNAPLSRIQLASANTAMPSLSTAAEDICGSFSQRVPFPILTDIVRPSNYDKRSAGIQPVIKPSYPLQMRVLSVTISTVLAIKMIVARHRHLTLPGSNIINRLSWLSIKASGAQLKPHFWTVVQCCNAPDQSMLPSQLSTSTRMSFRPIGYIVMLRSRYRCFSNLIVQQLSATYTSDILACCGLLFIRINIW